MVAVAVAGSVAGAVAGGSVVAGAVVGAVAVAGAEAEAVAGAVAVSVAVVVAGAAVAATVAGAGVVAGAVAGAGAVAIFFPPILLGFAFAIRLVSIAIRFAATAKYIGLGLRMLPGNFRRLALCTSPLQVPELVPGLPAGETKFTLPDAIADLKRQARSVDWGDKVLGAVLQIAIIAFCFLPAWLYRFTLKSTAWFWWPLAFLGSDLQQAREPRLFHRRLLHSLWGWTNIVLSFGTVAAFVCFHLFPQFLAAPDNPLLTNLGYLVVVDWAVPPWQLLALVSALLSLAIVYRANYINIEYDEGIPQPRPDLIASAERKFGWVERLCQVRLLLFILYWLIVAGHTVLYFNSLKCWFARPPNVYAQAAWIYGDRLPHPSCNGQPARASAEQLAPNRAAVEARPVSRP